MQKKLTAEFLGTLFLLMTVIGSGIMGEALAQGNDAIALLGNTIATGAILVVLITIFGPISGAHFNPAVTLVMKARGELSRKEAAAYIVVQIIAAVSGVLIAHLMFDLPILQESYKARTGVGQWTGELVATFGLLATILGSVKYKPESTAMMVGLYITAGYWFTSSTSFANPAVTIARSFSNTFAGIAPEDVIAFIACQLVGAFLAYFIFASLTKEGK
ncbi:MIP/aquaporin family protein [Temperatibacter marinus]|uniref:MIP/aquaporin family protein n=1 Tax=Temperatibacter marinus TaxID=1456591 RepID=A0AA52EA56_9PROT|nr:MIP/aquaporin family protein [Temperatibacter marinus]WND01532.1 MIP/aquaporin family protein [Temperatibacter marinus]